MNKYKIKALEQEQWERHYIVEAESEEEAKDLIICGNGGDKQKQEMYNFEVSIDKIEEIMEEKNDL
jgi:hypothetical protein